MNDILKIIAKEKQERIGKLDLSYSNIEIIPDELIDLAWLDTLNLIDNPIKDFSRLSKLQNLVELSYYSDPNYNTDHSFLNKLPKLSRLFIIESSLSNGNFLSDLVKLKLLSLKENEISELLFLITLTNLEKLELTDNNITDIFPLNHLKRLTLLYLGSNKISDVTPLANLSNLKHLRLYSNQISNIDSLDKLNNLEEFIVFRNKISKIHFSNSPKALKKFDLSNNEIIDIHFEVEISNLEELNLGNNKLTNISFLNMVANLKTLNLSNNEILDYTPLEKLANLTSLDLSSNQIADYSFLEKLTNLTLLDLRRNQITDYSFLEKLTKLKTLNLPNSQISDISFLENLALKNNLKSLNISNNKITDLISILPLVKKGIPVKWGYLIGGGNHINVEDNPLENPPIEIVKQGNEAIIKYFEELENQTTIALYEAKMLIVGEGGVGKTSLLRKLINEKEALPEEAETTKGIDIQEYHFETAGKQDFRINMWDFGGQEIYHATHQFFLTKRSLYVLVDDTRKDDKTIHDATFNYWLQTIALFGGDSPIVIVQNEKGDRSKVLDLKSIQSQFSNVKDTYPTNLLTCRNLAETKTALEFYIQQLPHIGTKLPKSWVDIRNAVEELEGSGTHYISRKEYLEICDKHDTDEETALILSQYLHDLGVFLHFQADDILCKTVILHNEWATDAVYKVLDCESVKTAKGRFTREDLKTIWGDADCQEKYRNMHPELLALMKEFKLCYELEGEKHTYLAPQLFAESQPDYVWDETDNLIVKLKYGFMPKGLISQFIVRMHRYVKDLETAWKHGAILENANSNANANANAKINENTKAEVVSLYAQSEIRIRVRGVDNKRFLDIVLEEFDKIHSLFEGIKVDKLIPCNCETCQKANWKGKYYFKYEVLKRAYLNNISEVQCQESFKNISVHRLINDTLIAKRMDDFSQTSKEYERMKIIQNHSGKGDNIGGNKTENHYYGTDKTVGQMALPLPLFDNNPKRQPIDKTELKDLIVDGDTDEVFEVLLEKSQDDVLSREIELLKTNWRGIKRQHRKSTISDNDFEVKNAKIVEVLLEWIGEW